MDTKFKIATISLGLLSIAVSAAILVVLLAPRPSVRAKSAAEVQAALRAAHKAQETQMMELLCSKDPAGRACTTMRRYLDTMY